MRWSLKARLSVGLAASLVLLLTLQWALVSLFMHRLTSEQLLARLDRDAESLLSGTHVDANGALLIDPTRVSAVYQRPFSGHYYVVLSGGETILSRSLWDTGLSVPMLTAGRRTDFRAQGPEQRPILVQARGYRKHEREMTVAMAEDLTELNTAMLRFQLTYGAVSAAVLAILLLLQRGIVSFSLRPLEAVRENMARLERGDAAQIETRGPLEIAPLIAQPNRLLGSMSNRSRRSREALGNLAHALKTRLAVVGQAAQAAELAAHAHLRETLLESTSDMRRIIERELKRARLLGSALPGRRVDLHSEIDALVRTLQGIYVDKSLKIEWEVALDAQFNGDREDLLELLGNLLDNACKWSQGRVSLQTIMRDGICFLIEDDGPGCTPDALQTLTRRGFRADESKPGSGLGLAIVRDIVESYNGTLLFVQSPGLGGMCVEVHLPNPGPNQG
jgi:signal transduction histidine kinase